jgi:hypothetical protein
VTRGRVFFEELMALVTPINAGDRSVPAVAILTLGLLAGTPRAAELPRAKTIPVNETPKEAGISAADREQIISASADDPGSDWDRDRASDLRFRRLSPAGSDLDGILVRSAAPRDCGATGNCTVWLFRRINEHLKLILSNAVADRVGVQTSTSHGLPTIVLSANQSAAASEVDVFEFDGQRYVRTQCYLAGDAEGLRGSVQSIGCGSK